MTDRELLSRAKAASINAYVPYSRFAVGAALECTDGTVFTGAPRRCGSGAATRALR
jgi:cytidine deaminase